MKLNYKYFYILLLVLGLLSHAPSSHAFFNIFGAGAVPVVDPINIGGEAANVFTTTLSQISSVKSVVNDKINNLKKAIASKIAGFIGNRGKNKKIVGSKKLVASSTIDLGNPKEIRPQIEKMFFQYPSTDVVEQRAYRSKAQEFYDDSIIEAYTAVRGLESTMQQEMWPEINQLLDDLENNPDNIECPDTDANDNINSQWCSVYKANQAYERLLIMIEELTAIRAQLTAAAGIKDNIIPIQPKKAPGKQSFLLESKFLTSQIDSETTIGFAQSAQEVFEFVTPPAPKYDIPFSSSMDKVAELSKFEPIGNEIRRALDYHNTLQSLPTYRDIFKRYDQIARQHAKALEMLQISDKCGVAFLARYYNNPIIAWSARDLSKQANEHQIRGGISGWAYNAFELAKAEEGSAISAEDVSVEIDYENPGFDTSSAADRAAQEAAMIKKIADPSYSAFDSKAQEEAYAKDSRKIAMLGWNIGAQAIKSLNLEPSKWKASVKKDFPIWEDQRRFYNQYLDKKYANIAKYIQGLSYSKVVEDMANMIRARDDKITIPQARALATNTIAPIKNGTNTVLYGIITQARLSIYNLGDEAFKPESYARIQTIHENMIKALKAYELTVSSATGNSVGKVKVLASLLEDNIAGSAADTQYFVGAQAKKRDLQLPKAPLKISSAPMREIVFFDDVDWSNAKPLSKKNFLNYGADIPQIWKEMLKDKAFVETEFNLKEALTLQEGDDPELALLRAGRYPCMVGNLAVDIAMPKERPIWAKLLPQIKSLPNGGFRYKIHTQTKRKYANCTMERIENNKVINDKYGSIETEASGEAPKEQYSELGVLLKSETEFSDIANNIFAGLSANKNKPNTDGKEDKKETFDEFIRRQSPFIVNQVGDFLRVAEAEMDLRKSKEEVEQDIEIAKWGEKDPLTGEKISDGLYDKLIALGFTPSDNFNLFDEEDYQLTFNKLNDAKQEFLSNADVSLIGVDTFDNEVAEEKARKYSRIIKALQLDTEAYLPLGENVEPESEVVEAIKTEKVNREANGTYQKEADAAMEDAINNFSKPFCATY